MNCFCNHPRQIFCGILSANCENNVVNPVVSTNYGFFNNTLPGQIESEAVIPLTFVLGSGNAITQNTSTTGTISLMPGVYEISYTAGAVVPTGNAVSVELQLNGVAVDGTELEVVVVAGQTENLTQTIMLNVPAESVLALVNTTTETVDFTNASIAIRRL